MGIICLCQLLLLFRMDKMIYRLQTRLFCSGMCSVYNRGGGGGGGRGGRESRGGGGGVKSYILQSTRLQ